MLNKTILWLTVGGLLALAAACGKTENPATPTAQAENAVEKPGGQPSNAEAASTETAKTTVDMGATAADTVVPPMTEAATNAPGTANAAPESPQGEVAQTSNTLASLSQDQMVQGLEDALTKGLQQAIARLGHDGGFLTNLNVKIPMPEKLQKVETALRATKQDKLADDFVATMNHAAEQAVPEASGVFADTLKQMTIDDARSILNGPNDAATQYFQKTTQTNLYAKFYPIVQKATAETGVTAAYKNLMEKANVGKGLGSFGSSLGGSLLGKDSMDIDAYVTNKAMDGLFKMVAEEEKQIRQNPVARTTATLQRVFGALKR